MNLAFQNPVVSEPDVRADIYFVPYGYQIETRAVGQTEECVQCRDFGGNYPISKLKVVAQAVIIDAIQNMERRALSPGKAFWFHYNKPASRAAGKPVLTVHYEGKCHMVSEIDCRVAIKTRISKRQPFCSLAGKGFITFENGVAIIR